VPFLPFILFAAYMAASRSARFALGWATALFFGQIPGNKGNMLAMVALLSLGWAILLIGGGIPLIAMLAGERLGFIPFGLGLTGWQVAAIVVGCVAGPPALAAFVELAGFEEDRSLERWLRRVPLSYPVSVSLGLGVLLMVLVAPFVILMRIRRRQALLQVPLVIRDADSGASDVADAICGALASAGYGDAKRGTLDGPFSWPLRTIGFAARHLLGSVVRGDPQRLSADDFEVIVYATNAAVLGPKEESHRVRAAIHKHLALTGAFLTWTEESQSLEAELTRLHRESGDDLDALAPRLDELQERLDRAPLTSDEWNLLYRLRLQVERAARLSERGEAPPATEPSTGNGTAEHEAVAAGSGWPADNARAAAATRSAGTGTG
jgi:hypothetical protein